MALTENTLVSGYDLTAIFGGYASALMQAIQRALPESTFGMILVDSSTPDVSGSYAWRTRCLWIDTTNTATPVLKAYRTTGSPGWFAIADAISNSTITTAMIQNGAVTLAKLYAPGIGEAAKLLRVNAAGTGFELASVSTIITDFGIIPIGSLDSTSVPVGEEKFVGCIGNIAGDVFWRSADYIAGLFGTAVVQPSAVAPATVLTTKTKFLSSRTGDTTGVYRVLDPDTDITDGAINGDKLTDASVVGDKISDASIPVDKLTAGTDGYIPSTVAGSVVWVSPSALAGTLTKFVSTIGAGPSYLPVIPTVVATPVTIAHGLAGIPQSVRVVMYCNTTNLGYAVGKEIDITGITNFDGTTFDTAFSIKVDATNVIIGRVATGNILINSTAGTGPVAAITPASWSIKVYCLYLS